MIEADKRKAVIVLHEQGKSEREIASDLRISRDSVRRIIDQGGALTVKPRSDQKEVDPELLRLLFQDCEGWLQRVHEKLGERDIKIGYSTLTRLIQKHGIGEPVDTRCYRVPDQPGAEIQHDTSPYHAKLGGISTPVVASLLYYRYCKHRYLKFYRNFNRFQMKCFFYEALTHFKYVAPICVIDNTNLARWYGTGKDAVFMPEMVIFAEGYGFEWLAHEKGHSDRKAGEERSFWTVETNFFPGRKFSSLEDLNEQALKWSLETMANRAQTDAKIVPNLAFETEKAYLKKIPPYIPEPYEELERGTDQYGYAAWDGNYYWVPGRGRESVKLLRYRNRVQIYRNREMLAEYPLPPFGTKNKKFPDGKDAPTYQPKSRKQPTACEEQAIRAVGNEAVLYLDWIGENKQIAPQQKHRLMRQLHSLKAQLSATIFLQTLARAKTYRVADPKVIERMALLLVRDSIYDTKWENIGEEFETREIYHQGRLSTPADLSVYSDQLDLPLTEEREEKQEEERKEKKVEDDDNGEQGG
jgi:transposase